MITTVQGGKFGINAEGQYVSKKVDVRTWYVAPLPANGRPTAAMNFNIPYKKNMVIEFQLTANQLRDLAAEIDGKR